MTSEAPRSRPAWRFVHGTWTLVRRAVGYGLLGGFLMLVAVVVMQTEKRPDLEIWHTEHLDEEFTIRSGAKTFAEYLELEERLFEQLDTLILDVASAGPRDPISRFGGGLADPARWPKNWNRSFEWTADDARAGVLLLHGMSDSPYSMRSLGERLHAAGAHVVGLRIPGHGTAPSGLVRVDWQDMAAAVELTMRHLDDVTGEAPLYVVGYSNGGALAVHYTLNALADDGPPLPAAVVLLSPEIGITKLASLARWQKGLGRVLGLEKLGWNSILPECDPFKYQSFALNAGDEAYRITIEVQKHIKRLEPTGALARFPPVLVFQSVVDATVTADAVVTGLLERLPGGGRELVAFDLNRTAGIEFLLKSDPGKALGAAVANPDRHFGMTIVTNESPSSQTVVARRFAPGRTEETITNLGTVWPAGVYSLSHLALPFEGTDPLYGGPDAEPSPGVHLGNLVLRGERGVLQLPASDILRQRWNPFHAYLEQRMMSFVGLSDG